MMRDGLSLNIRSDDQQDSYAAMSITEDPEDRIVVFAVDVPNRSWPERQEQLPERRQMQLLRMLGPAPLVVTGRRVRKKN